MPKPAAPHFGRQQPYKSALFQPTLEAFKLVSCSTLPVHSYNLDNLDDPLTPLLARQSTPLHSLLEPASTRAYSLYRYQNRKSLSLALDLTHAERATFWLALTKTAVTPATNQQPPPTCVEDIFEEHFSNQQQYLEHTNNRTHSSLLLSSVLSSRHFSHRST